MGVSKQNLKDIGIFGTPVTVNKPGYRTTKGHPHIYHVYFHTIREQQRTLCTTMKLALEQSK